MPAGRPRKHFPTIDTAPPRELTDRPDPKAWTKWEDGRGDGHIERVWWEARVLHFPRWNISHWYDGSLLVGIENWAGHHSHWSMRKPPADWQPLPPGYREAAGAEWYAHRRLRLHQERHTARLVGPRRWKLDPLPRECAGSLGPSLNSSQEGTH